MTDNGGEAETVTHFWCTAVSLSCFWAWSQMVSECLQDHFACAPSGSETTRLPLWVWTQCFRPMLILEEPECMVPRYTLFLFINHRLTTASATTGSGDRYCTLDDCECPIEAEFRACLDGLEQVDQFSDLTMIIESDLRSTYWSHKLTFIW
jgi:hypothetical protein